MSITTTKELIDFLARNYKDDATLVYTVFSAEDVQDYAEPAGMDIADLWEDVANDAEDAMRTAIGHINEWIATQVYDYLPTAEETTN
jgi:hypothetical protein